MMAKGVKQSSGFDKRWLTVGAAIAGGLAMVAALRPRRPAQPVHRSQSHIRHPGLYVTDWTNRCPSSGIHCVARGQSYRNRRLQFSL